MLKNKLTTFILRTFKYVLCSITVQIFTIEIQTFYKKTSRGTVSEILRLWLPPGGKNRTSRCLWIMDDIHFASLPYFFVVNTSNIRFICNSLKFVVYWSVFKRPASPNLFWSLLNRKFYRLGRFHGYRELIRCCRRSESNLMKYLKLRNNYENNTFASKKRQCLEAERAADYHFYQDTPFGMWR